MRANVPPACPRKLSTVDRQHERILEDRSIEPVRHREIISVGICMPIGALRPFVYLEEVPQPPFPNLAQGNGNRSWVAADWEPPLSSDSRVHWRDIRQGQGLTRPCSHATRCVQASNVGFDDLADGPDQHVGIPARRHASSSDTFSTLMEISFIRKFIGLCCVSRAAFLQPVAPVFAIMAR